MRPGSQRRVWARTIRGRVVFPRTRRILRRLPLPEWKAVHAFRPNLLIEGPELLIEETLVALRSDFGGRFVDWQQLARSEPIQLSPTILVPRLETLSWSEQQRLLEELDARLQHLQVIATTTAPIFDLVEQHAFRADLYYRLAAVRLTVGPLRN